MTKQEIFKFQWPIVGDKILVYNEDRLIEFLAVKSEEFSKLFEKHDKELKMKLYVVCKCTMGNFNKVLEFEFMEVVPYEEWPEW